MPALLVKYAFFPIWYFLASFSKIRCSKMCAQRFRFLPIPFDVPDKCPDPQRSWLRPTPSEAPDSHLAYWFLPTPSEVPDSCPDWQRFWLRPSSWEILDLCPDPQGFWLRSTPLKVPDSHPDPQRSLALAHSLSGYSTAWSTNFCQRLFCLFLLCIYDQI